MLTETIFPFASVTVVVTEPSAPVDVEVVSLEAELPPPPDAAPDAELDLLADEEAIDEAAVLEEPADDDASGLVTLAMAVETGLMLPLMI